MSEIRVGDDEVAEAVNWFWATRSGQEEAQRASEKSTRGQRASVLGGAQLDGFASLIEDILVRNGVPEDSVLHDRSATLPGYFRHAKRWDIAVVENDQLLAAIEMKSQASSFGNNFNNRVEEAVGSSTDLQKAYEEDVLEQSSSPWIGYLMLLADNEDSRSAVGVREPNFDVDEDFKGASYADRYELLCERMVRQQVVDGAAFIMSDGDGYREPNPDLRFDRFARRMTHYVLGEI
jgi:hypothetical protein